MEMHGDLARRYRDFAAHARGESPCFEDWALGVADDAEVHAWLAELPRLKQQPNLVFAAARWHGAAAPAPYAELKRVLLDHEAEVKETIRERSTQTNEVGRLATLVPAFGLFPEPLVLVEVGASAGLCLFPDRYDYEWAPGGRLAGAGGPTLTASVDGPVPLPAALPRVVQRIGLDLHPLSVYDDDAVAWLETLVWPEQDDRRSLLHEAIEIARAEPPDLRQGDLLAAVPALVEEAGRWGTPVVFHSAVIAYLDLGERTEFAATMADLVARGSCHWVSNEAPRVLEAVTATAPDAPPHPAGFVLGVDGRAVAGPTATVVSCTGSAEPAPMSRRRRSVGVPCHDRWGRSHRLTTFPSPARGPQSSG
ncbi:DUF2332 domain-containing protein [Nocardioides terrisoli]|uniref:DUF2332 domain-containing protein n=1 Tax=Nocardioides terrisoli TaxID=3388267 RepID=UPI00287BA9B0|nr:DUF2332 domain-containing protein [Nocardioides marmorisolisilvae]